jgi:hypothetical protein
LHSYYFYYVGEYGYDVDELDDLDVDTDLDGELDHDLSEIRSVPQPGGVFRRKGPQMAWVCTGSDVGYLPVRGESLSQAPPDVEPGWDCVAEISLFIRSGDLRVLNWDTSGTGDEPNLALAGPGWYRLRGHVRGRDADWHGRGDVSRAAEEEHHLLVWPEAFAESTVLVGPDEMGARILDIGPI